MKAGYHVLFAGSALAAALAFGGNEVPGGEADTRGLEHGSLPGVALTVPPEGRWSIATAWRNEWPAAWRHAAPTRSEATGPWTLYHGELHLPEGRWILRDAVRPAGKGQWECLRRWEWTGDQPLDEVTLSVRWQIQGAGARPFLPAISYYDNPAGQAVDPTRVPVIGPHPGARGYYEEHRYSMPFAAVEAEHDGTYFTAALHSRPSPLRYGTPPDLWWSLGLTRRKSGAELALLSGPVASNGKTGVVKASQRSFLDVPGRCLRVPPGAVIEKRFRVQLEPAGGRGHGFRPAVRASLAWFDPSPAGDLPPFEDVIRAKFSDATGRWREGETFAGIDAFPDEPGRSRPWIDLGWAGQSEALAYPLLVLGERFDIERAEEMASRSLDFICTSPFVGDQGFSIRYDYAARRWLPRRNPLSQAQTLHNMLAAYRVAEHRPGIDRSRWAAFIGTACDLHAARVLDADWKPISTSEGFLIAPLAEAAVLLEKPRYLEAARKAADHYGTRHESMDEPYWGGTLDARCEDKEGAWAALQGFLAMYEITREARYLAWAQHAADVVVSYVYVWDVPMPPGRLADHGFRSSGWTSVSVQNMHLDVYGVLCAPALWRLGEHTGHRHYRDLARLMVVTCGQLVDPDGGQGEQLHQTNYAQHYRVEDLGGVRGDYVERWDVFWITAHFLQAAARFEEMGVDWSSW